MNNVKRSKKAIKFLEGVSSNQCGAYLNIQVTKKKVAVSLYKFNFSPQLVIWL